MRLTLFWYMILSPFVEFPDPARVTPGEAKRGARLPRPKLCIYGGSGEIFSSHFANKIWTGNRNPQGDAIEAEEQVAAGRRQMPRSRDRAEGGIPNGRRPLDQSSHPIPGAGSSPISHAEAPATVSSGIAATTPWS